MLQWLKRSFSTELLCYIKQPRWLQTDADVGTILLARSATLKVSNRSHFHYISNSITLLPRSHLITPSSHLVTIRQKHVGSHKKSNRLTIATRLDAERIVRGLREEELKLLTTSMNDYEEEKRLSTSEPAHIPPTKRQLGLLIVTNSIPFIGFGFLDNAIMICAGDVIDLTIGVSLGISTMAAAGIGNLFSDIAGIGLAGYIEIWAARLGIEEPNLTTEQMTMKSAKRAEYFGRAIGIAIGCLIGMFPLLFIPHREDLIKEENKKVEVVEKEGAAV